MTENQNGKSNNVIDLAEKRKLQGTLSRLRPNPAHKNRKGASKGAKDAKSITWVHYVQFFAFLAVLALMMQLCQRGS